MKVFEMISRRIDVMLAFDIETTGLDGSKHDVTVVCTEDYHTGKRVAYEFDKVRYNSTILPYGQVTFHKRR